MAIASGGLVAAGVEVRNWSYLGENNPSPTFNGLVAEGNNSSNNYGVWNLDCYFNLKIRNSRMTGATAALYSQNDGLGQTTTYVSNSEFDGPTLNYSATAICAGSTDANGVFYANSCPQ